MSGSLYGAWAKCGRAKTHLETLKAEAVGSSTFTNEWMSRYPATPEAHRDGLEYRFYVEPEPLDTLDWALLAGDCLFNLRAALDHIAYELHVRRYKGRVPKDAAKASAFPIFTTRPAVDPAKWKDIKRLGFKQRKAIEFLQPYNRRNDKFWAIRDALGDIQTLNNIDKHRHLHLLQATAVTAPVPSYAGGVGWSAEDFPPSYGFEQISFLAKPLVGKTEVFRWTFDTVPPDIAEQVNKNHEITALVCLYEGGQARPMKSLLSSLVMAVEVVLKRFSVFLPYS